MLRIAAEEVQPGGLCDGRARMLRIAVEEVQPGGLCDGRARTLRIAADGSTARRSV
jgi:hypothetical protein